MCFSDDNLVHATDSMEVRRRKAAYARRSSTVTTASVSTTYSSNSNVDVDDDNIKPTMLKRSIYYESLAVPVESALTSALSTLWNLTCGLLVALATILFALWFPFALTPTAAANTYIPAMYHYVPEHSFFDNTAWTYGTDYALAVVMLLLAHKCWTAASNDCATVTSTTTTTTLNLRRSAAGLLLMYALSVTAGGLAHQFFVGLEQRNSPAFRFLWTVCVGTVTAAGGFMGSCAAELVRHFQMFSSSSSTTILITRHIFWAGFGLGTTLVCVLGGLSFQRPACDIFVAGTSQSPPTFFVMAVAMFMTTSNNNQATTTKYVEMKYRVLCVVGFILNAPLLPMYSLLVQHTDWSLAAVNTLLHTWLLVAWSMQALALHHMIAAIGKSHINNNKKKKKEMAAGHEE